MLFELKEIIQNGFLDGIRWFPFVLTIGILLKYLKFIDISIDGIAIISAISFTFFWNTYHSLIISFICTTVTALVLYWTVSFLIYELRINNILSGVVFTLIMHSISVLFVGESLLLDYSLLSALNSSSFLILTMSTLAILVELFFRSNLGTKIRIVSDNLNINTLSNPRMLILGIYCLAGIILSFGVVFYTSNLGLARSGGGFEFLITSLSSYLFIDRIIDLFIKIINHSKNYSYRRYIFFSLIESPVFKSIIGSILFQIIILLIIYYTANPVYWKLIFGLVLIVTIANPNMKLIFSKNVKGKNEQKGLLIKDLFFSYDNGYEIKKVFNNLNCSFKNGINIVWGDNGAGKTSLLRLIVGELKATSGIIYCNGKDISVYKKHKRQLFYITQNPFNSLSTNSTVFENIIASKRQKFFYSFSLSSPKKSLQYIDKGLITNYNNGDEIRNSFWVQSVSKLSGGQAQKLNLLISSVSDADIFLADEPTSGMDKFNFEIFINFINYLQQKDKLIIIVTHDLRFYNFLAQHFEIKEGNLRERNIQIEKEVVR